MFAIAFKLMNKLANEKRMVSDQRFIYKNANVSQHCSSASYKSISDQMLLSITP